MSFFLQKFPQSYPHFYPHFEMTQETTRLGEVLKVNSIQNTTHLGGFPKASTVPIFVDVLINAPVQKTFTYQWNSQETTPRRGQRVIVKFGRRQTVGLVFKVWQENHQPEFSTHLIEEVLDDGRYLNSIWFQLIEFCSSYYHYPAGMAALESLPKALRVLNAKGKEPVMARKGSDHVQTEPQESHTALNTSAEKNRVLTDEQQSVLNALLKNDSFTTSVLWGITGSGKTEVYIRYIQEKLENGGQALVLLPEINLTPAALALYRTRFNGKSIVLLHSNLSELTRTKNWFEVASGKAQIIIATRLGVLTPLPLLKLVIVDEEHDPSYRQQEGMKYNARDIAILTAKYHNVPVILGSATPSIETWKQCQEGAYQLLSMKKRAVSGACLPTIKCIDTTKHQVINGLSEPVINALKENIGTGQQSLIFLNRRGYAPQLGCQQCGWVASCSDCSVSLVWHKQEGALRCHYCGARHRVSAHCPDCANQDLKSFGRGTQRIEESLSQLLPTARILRIDSDSTRNKGQLEELLETVHSGGADLLIGTQMITKGHDFANINLVVALNTDSALVSHAYKAPERLFSQLMQVAGRAGRRVGNARMLVQTRYPEHPLLKAFIKQDYEKFASFELESRKQARMPPFSYQALLRADHKNFANCIEFLAWAKEQAAGLNYEGIQLCDPVPLAVVRVADTERAQMLIESNNRRQLHHFLDKWLDLLNQIKTPVRWFLEVDPSEL